jgi:hypothetical protein
MPLPQRVARERLRLPPPAAFLEKIRPAVAVDVPDAQTVGELRRADIGRNPVKCPALLGRGLGAKALFRRTTPSVMTNLSL